MDGFALLASKLCPHLPPTLPANEIEGITQ